MSRGTPFELGNKFGRGRPKGSRNKSNLVQRRLDEIGDVLINKAQVLALRGNAKVLLWCLNELTRRSVPAPKLKLPPIKTLDDVASAHDVVLNAVANYKCTAAHGQALSSMIDARRKTIETQDLAVKLEEVERRLKAA